MTNSEIKQLALHNARTFMAQAFTFYELATQRPDSKFPDDRNTFEYRADKCAKDAEMEFAIAATY